MSTTPRFIYSLITLLCFTALGVALLSQHVFGMRPCAWCVFQRLLLVLIGFCSLFAALLSTPPQTQTATSRWLGAVAGILSIGGVVAAWYQHTVAAQSFSCELGFADVFMTQSGLESALPAIFGIYATCADAKVELLGIEYALWGMSIFVVVIALLLWANLRKSITA